MLNSNITVDGALLVATEPEMNTDVVRLNLDDHNLFVREDLGGGRRGRPFKFVADRCHEKDQSGDPCKLPHLQKESTHRDES